MRQYNEKPSSIQNLGSDIDGAARHHRDTYETPEELRQKAKAKMSKNAVKALTEVYKTELVKALNVSTEQAIKVLKEYEFKKAFLSCEMLESLYNSTEALKQCDVMAFKSLVLSETNRERREVLRKKFNQTTRKMHKIRYIRPIELPNYFTPKTRDSFKEINGHEVSWRTKSKSFDPQFLVCNVKAVQFGNSLTENERIYVSENLIKSIQILQKYLNFDLSQLGFSYGARGKAGSIAHYQDSNKVLAFNRGWDGALIHELGHAIDYHLNMVSRSIPYSIRSAYRAKLESHPHLKTETEYYMKNTEIFARMFERWAIENIQERTSFMIFTGDDASLPDWSEETKQWFFGVMKGVLK